MKKRGRPRFEPTDAQKLQVVTLAANGFPNEYIADYLQINGKTLVKYFVEELRTSKKLAAAKLKLTIYQRGMKGELVAALAWLNNHGWGNDNSDGELLPPPQLGISFSAGGPGMQRTEPYDASKDDYLSAPPGSERLGDPVSVETPTHAIALPEPVVLTEQQYAEIECNNQEPARLPPPTTQKLWETLAQSPEEFNKNRPVEELDWGAEQARLARLHPQWRRG